MNKENIPLQPNEEIRPIIGYEGLYSITSFGRVWSHAKQKGFVWKEGSFLKIRIDEMGCKRVSLYKNMKRKIAKIHRLEAIAFIENPLSLPEVNHKDGVRTNNYIGTAAKNYTDGNLEWCLHGYNMRHALINGLIKKETSKFYGVIFSRTRKCKSNWLAYTKIDGKFKHIGYFLTELEAAKAYNKYIIVNNLDKILNNLDDVEKQK